MNNIIRIPDIHSNNDFCRALFTFENGMANTAKNPLSATWNGTDYYNAEHRFGTKSLDLSAMITLYSSDFAPVIEQGTLISFWFYAKTVPTANAFILSISDNGYHNAIQFIHSTSVGFTMTCKVNNINYYAAGDSAILSLNTWHEVKLYVVSPTRIVAVYNANLTRISTPVNPLSFTPTYTSFNNIYGYAHVNYRQFDGYIDSLQIKTGCSIPESALYNLKNRES